MVDQEAVEQGLVAILEARQADVALEIIGFGGEPVYLEGGLLLKGQHPRRQQSPELEEPPLVDAEGAPLVEHRVVEQVPAAQRHR